MSDLDEFFVHTATVETAAGNGPRSPRFADPVTVPCLLEAKGRMIRNADGTQSLSVGTLFAPAEYADALIATSRVTVGGVVASVATLAAYTSGALELPDHVEVTLV